MKISIAKVGQDIIFDRSSSKVDRSNTNGNVGLYKAVKMMGDLLGEDHSLFMISGNDISGFNGSLSIKDCKDNPEEAVRMSDVIIVIAGLSTYEKNDVLLDVISSSQKPVVILCEDPRCYRSMNSDERFSGFNVKLVLWQTYSSCSCSWHGRLVPARYFPLQLVSAYEHDESSMPSIGEKADDFIIAANTSDGDGSAYDRVKVLSSVLRNMHGIKVYGRLSSRERGMLASQDIVGEVKYDEMQGAMRSASSMLLVPIESQWVTSKYVECLMNKVLPIFHVDYEACLITTKLPLFKVLNCDDMEYVLGVAKGRRVLMYEYASMMYDELVKPYVDGRLLTSRLMRELLSTAHSW